MGIVSVFVNGYVYPSLAVTIQWEVKLCDGSTQHECFWISVRSCGNLCYAHAHAGTWLTICLYMRFSFPRKVNLLCWRFLKWCDKEIRSQIPRLHGTEERLTGCKHSELCWQASLHLSGTFPEVIYFFLEVYYPVIRLFIEIIACILLLLFSFFLGRLSVASQWTQSFRLIQQTSVAYGGSLHSCSLLITIRHQTVAGRFNEIQLLLKLLIFLPVRSHTVCEKVSTQPCQNNKE